MAVEDSDTGRRVSEAVCLGSSEVQLAMVQTLYLTVSRCFSKAR